MPPTRHSTRLLPPPPSRLLLLSPELLDRILHFLSPTHSPSSRRQLSLLLLVSPLLTPHVRRRLYKKVVLTLGDRKRRERRWLLVVDASDAGGRSVVGEHVRMLRVQAPEPDMGSVEQVPDARNIVPSTKMAQREVVELMTRVLSRVPGLQALDLDTRIGTPTEDEVSAFLGELGGSSSSSAKLPSSKHLLEIPSLAALSAALCSLNNLTSFSLCVPDVSNRLQILSLPHWPSPLLTALSTWSHLTTLDLWRVSLEFDALNPPPPPTFNLRKLNVRSSALGGAAELEWLVGSPVSTSNADTNIDITPSARGQYLTHLVLCEIEFLHAPHDSTPLLVLFQPTVNSSPVPPCFASSLVSLTLSLPSPPNSPLLLSPLVLLSSLSLSGRGITIPLFSSLFLSAPLPALKSLTLQYCPFLPLSELVKSLPDKARFPHLASIDIGLRGEIPRKCTWEEMIQLSPPIWNFMNGQEEEADEGVEGFKTLVKSLKGRIGQGLVLLKNGNKVEAEDEEYDEDEEEDDGEEDDGDALFVLPDEDEEVWETGVKVDSDEESDY